MTIVRRGTRTYYYRSLRVDGRVVKQYVGHGPGADIVARHDALQRAERLAQWQTEWQEQVRARAVLSDVREFMLACDTVMRGSLVLAGYYQHYRGAWRRRHGERKNANQ